LSIWTCWGSLQTLHLAAVGRGRKGWKEGKRKGETEKMGGGKRDWNGS